MSRTTIWPALICLVISTIFAMQLSPSLAAQSREMGQRSTSSTKRDGMITGRVVTDDGLPAGEAIVEAKALGATILDFQTKIAECDDQGNFELTGLKPGAYLISASLPGYVSLNADPATEIHRPGEAVTIRLVRGGVITGRITDALGEPVEGIYINLRSGLEDRTSLSNPFLIQKSASYSVQTDDRGNYRIYGIIPGTYLVSVIDTPAPHYSLGNFQHDSPTYYSSGERKAATEIMVRGGEEITGIDIQHRGERGHSITGSVTGDFESGAIFNLVNVTLRNKATGEISGTAAIFGLGRFSIYGVVDGEYELTAQYFNERFGFSRSAPRQTTVKGADITGIDLKLIKAGSISGRVMIESPRPDAGCGQQGSAAVEEIALRVKKIDDTDRRQVLHLAAVDETGEFVQNLEDGLYRIIPDLPTDNWYLKAMTMMVKATPHKPLDLAHDGISVKLGQSLTGVELKVAENAAKLRGRLAVANGTQTKAGATSLPRWRVHLVPAEDGAAEDVLRYAETLTQSDGSFELKHLAPGKYLLLARAISEKESRESQSHLVAWDSLERAKLRRDAESLKQEIELRPCQQAAFILR
jgi:hypothetical protein